MVDRVDFAVVDFDVVDFDRLLVLLFAARALVRLARAVAAFFVVEPEVFLAAVFFAVVAFVVVDFVVDLFLLPAGRPGPRLAVVDDLVVLVLLLAARALVRLARAVAAFLGLLFDFAVVDFFLGDDLVGAMVRSFRG